MTTIQPERLSLMKKFWPAFRDYALIAIGTLI